MFRDAGSDPLAVEGGDLWLQHRQTTSAFPRCIIVGAAVTKTTICFLRVRTNNSSGQNMSSFSHLVSDGDVTVPDCQPDRIARQPPSSPEVWCQVADRKPGERVHPEPVWRWWFDTSEIKKYLWVCKRLWFVTSEVKVPKFFFPKAEESSKSWLPVSNWNRDWMIWSWCSSRLYK